MKPFQSRLQIKQNKAIRALRITTSEGWVGYLEGVTEVAEADAERAHDARNVLLFALVGSANEAEIKSLYTFASDCAFRKQKIILS